MPKHHTKDFCVIVLPCKVALEVEMAQLHLMATHAAMKDSHAMEVDPTIATNKTQFHAPIEILHLENEKQRKTTSKSTKLLSVLSSS